MVSSTSATSRVSNILVLRVVHRALTRCLDGLAQLTSNENLVLAGTLHGIHAITRNLSPTGTSSGAHVIEGESFKMTILLTPTGQWAISRVTAYTETLLISNEVRFAHIPDGDNGGFYAAESLRGIFGRCHEESLPYTRDADSKRRV